MLSKILYDDQSSTNQDDMFKNNPYLHRAAFLKKSGEKYGLQN